MNISKLQDYWPQGLNRFARDLQNQPERLDQRQKYLINTAEGESAGAGRLGQAALRISLNRTLVLGGQPFPGITSQLDQAYSARPFEFDFKSVARNVLDFITERVRSAAGDSENPSTVSRMLEQARDGVERGFKEAKDILSDANLLNEDLETGIDKSFDLISKGLDDFNLSLSSDLPKNVVDAQVGRYQQGSLELTTKEGDQIAITFEDSLRASYAVSQGEESYYLGASSRFSLRVDGHLDEDERAAIGRFLENVDELAGQFFDGDLDVAFERATQLELDEEELASFALNLNQVQTVQMQRVYPQADNSTQEALSSLSDYMALLRESSESVKELLLPDARSQLSNVVVQLRTGLEGGILTAAQENFDQFNLRMLELMEKVSRDARENQTQGREPSV